MFSTSRRIAAALVVASLALGACADDEPPVETPAEPTEPTEPAERLPPPPTPAATRPPSAQNTSLAGTWWALAQSLPYKGLRMTLVDTDDDGHWEGSWISFDWRGSETASNLSRSSRPVAISARREGDEFVIVGPSPEIDASGRPTGDRGTWEVRVQRTGLPGEPVRFAGRMRHAEFTADEGAPVDLESSFRVWQS